MKSKNIPVDIKTKSIKEAQNEIQDIISYLENGKTNLKESVDKYDRMIHLNLHIQEQFKLKLNKIKSSNFENQTHQDSLEKK